MSLFDGYEMVSSESGATFMSMSASGISFSKAVVTKIGSPMYVSLWINKEKKMIIITPAPDGKSEYSFKFSRTEGAKDGVLMHRRNLQKKIFEMVGVTRQSIEGTIYVDGEYYSDENAVQFDTKMAYVK